MAIAESTTALRQTKISSLLAQRLSMRLLATSTAIRLSQYITEEAVATQVAAIASLVTQVTMMRSRR